VSAPSPINHAVVLRQVVFGPERAARLARVLEILERAAQQPAAPLPAEQAPKRSAA
jgi:hypothetical protein